MWSVWGGEAGGGVRCGPRVCGCSHLTASVLEGNREVISRVRGPLIDVSGAGWAGGGAWRESRAGVLP